jgi:predicted RNA binding protein YcfA (HicA-like mRNA interferase family)
MTGGAVCAVATTAYILYTLKKITILEPERMGKYEKLFTKILSGSNDSAMHFTELIHLLLAMGFSERIKGSHHIYYKQNIEEILNIQPNGSQAKAYQVKQVRNLILKYHLEEPDE